MAKSKNRNRISIALLTLVLGLAATVRAQDNAKILEGAELARVVPVGFYFEGQSAPTQMRNSAAARLASKRLVIAGLVDTSGYSTEVRAKYEGFFITDSPITVGGSQLGTGAYGFGFSSDGKMNIFEISGKLILSVEAKKDEGLKRPRPLMMAKEKNEVRLYDGRNYVVVAAQ